MTSLEPPAPDDSKFWVLASPFNARARRSALVEKYRAEVAMSEFSKSVQQQL